VNDLLYAFAMGALAGAALVGPFSFVSGGIAALSKEADGMLQDDDPQTEVALGMGDPDSLLDAAINQVTEGSERVDLERWEVVVSPEEVAS